MHLLYLSLAGTQRFWLRASRREFEMRTQRPEWKPASKTRTNAHSHAGISDHEIIWKKGSCVISHRPLLVSFPVHLRLFFFPAVSHRAYWGLRNHFPGEADALYNSLESSYQRTLQSCLKSSGSVASLPQSDRSSSSSQESLK